MSYSLPLAKWSRLEDCLKDKGVTYAFPEGRNDGFMYQTGNPEGPAKFHIHSIEHVDDDDMVFTKLLVKSSNWRGGQEPDLAVLPTGQWVGACSGMDSSVIAVVEALEECFNTLGAVGPY